MFRGHETPEHDRQGCPLIQALARRAHDIEMSGAPEDVARELHKYRAVARVLDVLDDIRLGHVRRIARDHLLQGTGADADLLGKANEVAEEVFFAGKQTETGHVTSIIEGS